MHDLPKVYFKLNDYLFEIFRGKLHYLFSNFFNDIFYNELLIPAFGGVRYFYATQTRCVDAILQYY